MVKKGYITEEEVLPIEKEVVLPESLRKALYALAQEPAGVEWGGGLDFEVVKGKPKVERLLSYLGAEAKIPARVFEKYISDVEVIFHTHPSGEVLPSKGDIYNFLSYPYQVSVIVGPDKILIMEKTPRAKPVKAEVIDQKMSAEVYLSRKKFDNVMKDFGLEWQTVPRSKEVKFDLEVVRSLKGEEFSFQKSLIEADSPVPFVDYLLKLYRVPQKLRFTFKGIIRWCMKLYNTLVDYYEKKEKVHGRQAEELKKEYEEYVQFAIEGLQDQVHEWYGLVKRYAKMKDWEPAEKILEQEIKWEESPTGVATVPSLTAHSDVLGLVGKIARSYPARLGFLLAPHLVINMVGEALTILEAQQERQKVLSGKKKVEKESKEAHLQGIKDWITVGAAEFSIFLGQFLDKLRKLIDFTKYQYIK